MDNSFVDGYYDLNGITLVNNYKEREAVIPPSLISLVAGAGFEPTTFGL